MATVGLVLMAVGIVATPKSASAEFLMLAVIGAGLIMLVGDKSKICEKVLGNSVLVYVGTVSYSLYLWHQPVFVFARALEIDAMLFMDYLVPLAMVFALSHLTYRLVEAPFRNRKTMSLRRVGLNFAGMLVPIIVFGTLLANGSTLSLLSADAESRKYLSANIGTARGETWKTLDNYEPAGRSIRIAVIGNSHAKEMFNAMQLSDFSENVDFVPLIAIRHCRMSRKDRLLQLVFPGKRRFVISSNVNLNIHMSTNTLILLTESYWHHFGIRCRLMSCVISLMRCENGRCRFWSLATPHDSRMCPEQSKIWLSLAFTTQTR